MSHRCLDADQLAAVGALPPDHPQRREAGGCPRCGSLLDAMAAFMAGNDELTSSETGQAERRLSAFVRDRLAANPAGRRRAAFGMRWGWGAGLATAATVLLLLWQLPERTAGPSGTVRGGSSPATGIIGDAAVTAVSGGLRLEWTAAAAADHYDVILFTAELDTAGTLGALPGPGVTVPDSLLDPDGAAGAMVRIRALGGGKVVAESRLQDLPRR